LTSAYQKTWHSWNSYPTAICESKDGQILLRSRPGRHACSILKPFYIIQTERNEWQEYSFSFLIRGHDLAVVSTRVDLSLNNLFFDALLAAYFDKQEDSFIGMHTRSIKHYTGHNQRFFWINQEGFLSYCLKSMQQIEEMALAIHSIQKIMLLVPRSILFEIRMTPSIIEISSLSTNQNRSRIRFLNGSQLLSHITSPGH
jgi:hypothetical protein